MKTTEGRAKAKRIRTNIQRYILDVTFATGILAVSLAVPKVGKLLRPAMRELAHPDRTNAKIRRSFRQLLKNGELVLEEKNGRKFVSITDKGKLKLFKLYGQSNLHMKKKWDKRWRVVIYDIKETRKSTRMQVSRLLQGYGFYKLQASVWAYPYPCEELIALLKAELKIGKQLLYAIIEELENDAHLREHFALD